MHAFIPNSPLKDPALEVYRDFFLLRDRNFTAEVKRIRDRYGSLRAYANLHTSLGAHRVKNAKGETVWRLREYMPCAEALWLTTDRLNFQRHASFRYKRHDSGIFELVLPEDKLRHGDYMELRMQHGTLRKPPERRVPAFAGWVEQDQVVQEQWCARHHDPDTPYQFRHHRPKKHDFPRIYEAHVGMAQSSLVHSDKHFGTYRYFTDTVLPRIKSCGYTSVQLMGILEHPLYRSFGYQVSSYFAPSSRYGTPDEFKKLVDTAHGLSLTVFLDITHGHACPNTEQGLAAYDGSPYFFNEKLNQWGTPSFDYSQEMTRRFLLSNCRYWLEEFRVDGFRFDAVGNMIYRDHGIDDDFSHVGRCFYGKDGAPRTDVHGETYLCLANLLTHEIHPQAVTIAEEFSGMPGLTCPPSEGGLGFDQRFAMGIPDYWEKCIEEPRDMGSLWHEMTNHRPYDRTVSYVECHDQCINGDNAMIWRMLGDDMYHTMSVHKDNWNISRGLALYRLMRLVTLTTADTGYLNFMGNEFGHPEWLDAEKYAHRQWHLADSADLKYAKLAAWDKAQLIDLVAAHLEEFRQTPLFRYIHEGDRILAFERGRLLFVFNFHELNAKERLIFAVTPGKYVELLSSDEERFAGHGNVHVTNQPVEHFTKVLSYRSEQDVTIYLPPLVALVLLRKD